MEPDDDDLDLDELDPRASTSKQTAPPRHKYNRRIPLRDLRLTGKRRLHGQDSDNEDLQVLVSDDDHSKHDSVATSGNGEEDAGLLSGRRASHQEGNSHRTRPGRSGRWKLLSFARRIFHIQLPSTSAREHREEDNHGSAERTIAVGRLQASSFPPNLVSNAKYTSYSFLPKTLYNEFSFFFNMYFLLVALSQTIPALRIGYLSTYIFPLAFVISVTLGKEAWDDIQRRRRDSEANSEAYKVLVFGKALPVDNVATRARRVKVNPPHKRSRQRRMYDHDGVSGVPREAQAPELCFEESASSTVSETIRSSKDLRVGDVLVLTKDQRVPADVIILKSFSAEALPGDRQLSHPSGVLEDMGHSATRSDQKLQDEALKGQDLENFTTSSDASGGGEAFVRTDQLDGETDWKLRLATPLAQDLPACEYVRLSVTAGKPDRRVNDFLGTIELEPKSRTRAESFDYGNTHMEDQGQRGQNLPLNIDNTAWANTVLASSTTVHALVTYTGRQTRAALSTSPSRSKTGLLEYEINSLTKILCFLTAALSFLLVALENFNLDGSKHVDGKTRQWYVAVMRFLILFSTIVPISLRVNLDLGKSVYAWFIHHDDKMSNGIPGTIVRTSTIPEDLGRIEYLLSDKTGTLTRNEMDLKKIHVGTVSYGGDAMEEVCSFVRQAFAASDDPATRRSLFTPSAGLYSAGVTRTRREIALRVRDVVLALALCHNVTPTIEEGQSGQPIIAYQASSPDEIAIVRWTEQVGLRVAQRDRKSIRLEFAADNKTVVKVEILNIFPFTSDSKRMGIVARFQQEEDVSNESAGEIVFYQKGADTVMASIVAANDWLDEETSNMAREGLRTLVVGRKNLSAQQYAAFASAYAEASLGLHNRDRAVTDVVKQHLEHDLDLLGVTGVEDKLQPMVKPSLELLRNAGIKIWMLTGDKIETARCVAMSSKLVSRGQYIHTIAALKRKEAALDALSMLHSQPNAALLIDGESLALYLKFHREAFISVAVCLPAVIACRCSPIQKAEIADLIRTFTKKRVACIGDGGNDVSMIQAADVGVGIVGKEGKQASLAADFSITQFAHLTKLLVWHGRNSYKRSAKLAQFVIHRGLIVSVCQTVFSVAAHFEPIALYRDWLLVGYATVYTMAPVFSLVLDRDVDEGLANLYPELYKELTPGKSLSYRTFFVWVGISIYQGLMIQGGSELLVPEYGKDYAPNTDGLAGNATGSPGFRKMVAVSYTVLVVNELIMVAAEITTWHPIMIFSILGTAAVYLGSMPFLGGYFDLAYVVTLGFWWRFAAISTASLLPVYAGKVIRRTVRPPSYRKVRGV